MADFTLMADNSTVYNDEYPFSKGCYNSCPDGTFSDAKNY